MFIKKFFLLHLLLLSVVSSYSMEEKVEEKEVVIAILGQQELKKEELLKKIYQQSELHIKHEDLSKIIDLVLNSKEESNTIVPEIMNPVKTWRRCIPTKPCAALGLSTTHIFITIGSSFLTWLVTFGSNYLITLSRPNSCNCTVSS